MSDRPFQLQCLDHIVLRCAHLEETMAFYTNVLGCEVERVVESIGLYQLRAGEALIDLVPLGSELGGTSPPTPGGANVAHYCLRVAVEDWQGVQTYLHDAGISSVSPERRYGADGYGLSLYIDDPEGNSVELKGAARAGSA